MFVRAQAGEGWQRDNCDPADAGGPGDGCEAERGREPVRKRAAQADVQVHAGQRSAYTSDAVEIPDERFAYEIKWIEEGDDAQLRRACGDGGRVASAGVLAVRASRSSR